MTSFAKFMTCSISVFLMISASFDTVAHAEKDKARYVAPNGVDQGLCDNPLRPCQSISFAVSRAAKGDRVLVASGTYELENLDDVIAIKSEIVPILGGYNRFDHFSSQSPSTNITRLIGLPHELNNFVESRGFHPLSDGKSKHSIQKISSLDQLYSSAQRSHSSAKCENGKVGNFTCKNIDLISHISLKDMSKNPPYASDIWGHVDLNNNNEYALIGLGTGIGIFDITIPEAPKEVGIISGMPSSWRDIKVYQYYDEKLNSWQAYAYATVDNVSDNVLIIDLNQLPYSVSLVKRDLAVSQSHNVYISNLDYSYNIALNDRTPTLQLVGSTGPLSKTSSFMSFSLDDPKSLVQLPLGGNKVNGYTHDGTSLLINDERKTTDCQLDNTPCEIFLDFNEQEIKVWNTTIAGQEKLLSEIKYNDVAKENQYVHSGWWSEDKRYMFAHDEFDEYRGELNTTLRIFDLQSLTNPQLAGVWKGPTKAIDHNGYVRGNRYYMSNYKRGLTILDITNPAVPKEIGHFDTFTASDSNGFDGAWGVYPYLPSGNIIVSDISGGLFILRDKTLNVDAGSVSFTSNAIHTDPNQSISVDIQRVGSNQEAVKVHWEIIPGNATAGDDYVSKSGSLTWNHDESDNKSITVDVLDNIDPNEVNESFFIRLYNPENGLTISSPSYVSVNISGKDSPGVIGFDRSSLTVAEIQEEHSINVYRTAGRNGEVSVEYALKSNTANEEDFVKNSGTLTWSDNDVEPKVISFSINNDQTHEADESFELVLTPIDEATLSQNSELSITIKDDENNTAPTLSLPENFEANTNQTINLTSEVSDEQGDEIFYQWEQTKGDFVFINTPDAPSISIVAPKSVGTFELRLTVTDFRGASTSKLIEISVKEPAPIEPTPVKTSGGINFVYLLLLALAVYRRKNYNK